MAGGPKRPDIHSFHDYREFLRDWLAFQKKGGQSPSSLRALARAAGLAAGYLPMVLSGARHLSPKALARISPVLGLSQAERSYLDHLVALGTSDSQDTRLAALSRMRRSRGYRKLNPREAEAYQYLTHWYYVAIRELARVPGFRADPEWIRPRLLARVPVAEIQKALEFLIEKKFLAVRQDLSAEALDAGNLDCIAGIYRLTLGKFHREMLALAAKSIEEVPSDERFIMGHTFPIDPTKWEEAKKIVTGAIEKIRALERKPAQNDRIYHVEISAFPLTRRRKNP